MRVADYRSAFSCCLLDLEKDQRHFLTEILTRSHFTLSKATSFDELKLNVVEEAPHFVVLSGSLDRSLFQQRLDWLKHTLPESQIFIVADKEQLQRLALEFSESLFDFIEWPIQHPVFVVRALDRAAELSFYLYQNEQLQQRLQPIEKRGMPESVSLSQLLIKLPEAEDRESVFDLFLQEFGRIFVGLKIIYFKYYPPRRTLMALKWSGVEDSQCQGVGINFNEHNEPIKVKDLRNPNSLSLLQELVPAVFEVPSGLWVPLEVLGEVQGLWLILGANEDEHIRSEFQPFNDLFTLFLEKLDLTQRFHLMNHLDLSTLLLIRTRLIQKIGEEVARSRRLEWPVSLLILSIDNSESLRSRLGEEELELLLKMGARILLKHSRVNDLLGRVGPDEIGILLPHTDLKGATKKAERIRSLIERADFSKVVQGAGRLTVSIGVSEYPSCCSDADELYQSADLALYQIKKNSKNAICVSSPPDGFTPDFVFRPERHSQR